MTEGFYVEIRCPSGAITTPVQEGMSGGPFTVPIYREVLIR
jgi:hypothetical protein